MHVFIIFSQHTLSFKFSPKINIEIFDKSILKIYADTPLLHALKINFGYIFMVSETEMFDTSTPTHLHIRVC